LVPHKIRADLTEQDPGGSDVPTHNGIRGRSWHGYRTYWVSMIHSWNPRGGLSMNQPVPKLIYTFPKMRLIN